LSDRRALPIAPRPIAGELLSSWQGRVACRYGLSGDELAVRLGARSAGGPLAQFADRDFAPSAAELAAWARGCRLSEDFLRAMALSGGARPQAGYVWGEAIDAGVLRRPVCLACLDEDAAAGVDHHLRKSWAWVEVATCRRHDRILAEACPFCLSAAGWRFRTRNDAAVLVCAACDRGLRSRRRPSCAGPSQFRESLGRLARRVCEAFEANSATAARLMSAARLLWAAPHDGGAPFIARLPPDLRLPPSVAAQVDRRAPLATASLGWRITTLIASAQLIDLPDARNDFGAPLFSLARLEAATVRRPETAAGKKISSLVAPMAGAPRPEVDASYRAMAETILARAEWRAVQGASASARKRMLGRLMNQALDRAPPGPGVAPGPAEPSPKKPPRDGRRAACAPASGPVAPRSRAG
jgi:hypothetical protein